MKKIKSEFSLTNDGFGVHTFELNICGMRWEEYKCVLDNVYASECQVYTVKEGESLCVLPIDCNGIRIYINRVGNEWCGIRVIVSPRMLLDNDAEPFAILRCCDNMKELEKKFNFVMFETLGENFTLDRFFLSRIDCCVNVMLSETYSAARYIKLIRRSIMYNGKANITKYESNVVDADEKNKHSFRIETDGLEFTAYDKYFQLEDIGENYESISDSMLRMEISVGRNHIRRANLENGLKRNIKTIEYFVEESQLIFADFVRNHFCEGDYYCVSFMKKLISISDCTPKIKMRMMEFVETQYNFDSFINVKEKILNEIGISKYCSMIKAFKKLKINPISLSYRDKHGEMVIPGLYTLLSVGKG